MDQNTLKQAAAKAAIAYVPDDTIIGVGTGSTVNFFIAELARIASRIKGAVSSSGVSSKLLREARIDVMELNDAGTLSVYVDGADEITPHLAMIKGGGAALTPEGQEMLGRFRAFRADADAALAALFRQHFPDWGSGD